MTRKKVEETPIKPEINSESPPSEEADEVTSVTVETPIETSSPAVVEPVKISEMPTKRVKHKQITFTEIDQLVLTWYNSRVGGQTYTRQQAADELQISVEDFNNSIARLQNTVLGETLGHLVN